MQIADIISISFVISLLGPSYMFALTRSPWWLILATGIIGAGAVVEEIKKLFGSLAPWGRPAGARACDAFCVGGSVGGMPGFPSGHMTASTMFVAALWFRLHEPKVLWIGLPWLGAMAWARWHKHCHNWLQIAGGGLFGGILGYAVHLIAV